ncbi:probable E3 ubiquitin-protein ligase RHY1A [Dendrobium catenatum]|uniref:RING-H2 finger protein ATL11 n=1 Tax=Dendrobium catenatum TaxID=906689 RepID=A0A2I0WVR1_9ASPA|nr:probable E3 ubiquitin-protein ligase RHY1A [Dendrobium catenatum]PKU79733.1 RING-H2 finger protein ATL11 [Dendrobium catenatum]
MTSALQLLYVLRSPNRRNQEPIGALESDHTDRDPDVRRSGRDSRRGNRIEDGDHSRRSRGGVSSGRHPKSCGSHMERELGRRSSRNGSGNSSNGGVSNTMLTHLGLTRNDQLPCAVEQARKRLLERLQSVSLTDNRQRSPNDESALVDGFDINNANLSPNSSVLNSELAISNKKKIPALRWDDFCAMKRETFRSSEEKHEDGVMAELTECCICLEGFKDGDWLIKLCCSHKFHPCCLEPWLRSSGDCPLCRADVIC